MKTVFVTYGLFHEIMEKISAEMTSRKEGINSGKFQYTRHHGTRWVGESSYLMKDGKQEWLYCVANYLYEAYK